MQTSDADLVGKVIESYQVVRSLGTGTMGNVFEAEHRQTGARVALKVLHPHHQGSEAASRFLREGKTLGLFRHRNIVELLEVGRGEDGALFLATELVRGVSLRDLMNDGRVEPRRALTIVRHVLEALGAAHAVGVVHRDVKPENIMLADGGSPEGTDLVKVLDFGVAKLLGDTAQVLGEANLTRVGLSVFGSPDYIAPEVALGKPVDTRADLYSAGAVLYELLAGRPPFDAQDPGELLRLHVTAAVPALAQRAPERTFTPQLEFVVAEALAKDPDKRFRSAAEMITAIDAALHSLDQPSLSALLGPMQAMPSEPTVVASPGAQNMIAPPALPAASTPPPATETSSLFGADRSSARTATPAAKPTLGELLRRNKMFVAAGAGTMLVVIVLAVALAGGDDTPAAGSRGDASTYLSLGHERFTAGRRADALAAYERAIRLSPKLASNDQLRANVMKTLEGKDAVAGVIALELLASQMKPAERDVIIATASTNKQLDIRRRAFAIAERDGFADKVDRVESWSLDLGQATTCDERRAAIQRLAEIGDKRSLAALKRAKAHKCVEKDATDAISRIEAGS